MPREGTPTVKAARDILNSARPDARACHSRLRSVTLGSRHERAPVRLGPGTAVSVRCAARSGVAVLHDEADAFHEAAGGVVRGWAWS